MATVFDLVVQKDWTYSYNPKIVIDIYVNLIANKAKSFDEIADEIIGYLHLLYAPLTKEEQKNLNVLSKKYLEFKNSIKGSISNNKQTYVPTTLFKEINKNELYDEEIIYFVANALDDKYKKILQNICGSNFNKEFVYPKLTGLILTNYTISVVELRKKLKNLYKAYPYPGDIEGLKQAYTELNNKKNAPIKSKKKEKSSKPKIQNKIDPKLKLVKTQSTLKETKKETKEKIEDFFVTRALGKIPVPIISLILNDVTDCQDNILIARLGVDYRNKLNYQKVSKKTQSSFKGIIKYLREKVNPVVKLYEEKNNTIITSYNDIPLDTFINLYEEYYHDINYVFQSLTPQKLKYQTVPKNIFELFIKNGQLVDKKIVKILLENLKSNEKNNLDLCFNQNYEEEIKCNLIDLDYIPKVKYLVNKLIGRLDDVLLDYQNIYDKNVLSIDDASLDKIEELYQEKIKPKYYHKKYECYEKTSIYYYFYSRKNVIDEALINFILDNMAEKRKQVFSKCFGKNYREEVQIKPLTNHEVNQYKNIVDDEKEKFRKLVPIYNERYNKQVIYFYDIPTTTLIDLYNEIKNQKEEEKTKKTITDYFISSDGKTLDIEVINLLFKHQTENQNDVYIKCLGADYRNNITYRDLTDEEWAQLRGVIKYQKSKLKPLIPMYQEQYDDKIDNYYDIPADIMISLYNEYYITNPKKVVRPKKQRNTIYDYFARTKKERLDNKVVDLLLENATEHQKQTLKEFLGDNYKEEVILLKEINDSFKNAIKNMKASLKPLIKSYNQKYNKNVESYYEIPADILIELYNDYYKKEKTNTRADIYEYFLPLGGRKPLDNSVVDLILDNFTEDQDNTFKNILGEDYRNIIPPKHLSEEEQNKLTHIIGHKKSQLNILVTLYQKRYDPSVTSYYNVPADIMISLYNEYYVDNERLPKKADIYEYYDSIDNKKLDSKVVDLLLDDQTKFQDDVFKFSLGEDYRHNIQPRKLNKKEQTRLYNAIQLQKRKLNPLLEIYQEDYDRHTTSYYEIPADILIDLYKQYYNIEGKKQKNEVVERLKVIDIKSITKKSYLKEFDQDRDFQYLVSKMDYLSAIIVFLYLGKHISKPYNELEIANIFVKTEEEIMQIIYKAEKVLKRSYLNENIQNDIIDILEDKIKIAI